MQLKDITKLFEYDYWATLRLIDLVQTLNKVQYEKDRGSSHKSIRGTMIHIFVTDKFWLDRWKGFVSPQTTPEEELHSLRLLLSTWTYWRSEMGDFLATINNERLQMSLAYVDPHGKKHTHPLKHQLTHILNHSSYHRGQISAMLAQEGIRVPDMDLITFYDKEEQSEKTR
jgi:uncharacterized damage-inducible protein DinB